MLSDVATLLSRLEEFSRSRPDRVVRLTGELPGEGGFEPFELLIFRGFSSSVSHPTAFDPDQPALPAEALVQAAELLQGLDARGDAHLHQILRRHFIQNLLRLRCMGCAAGKGLAKGG